MTDADIIRNHVADFYLLMDDKKYEEWSQLFTEDAVMYRRGALVTRGRQALLEKYTDRSPPGTHLSSNVKVYVEGDTARIASTCFFVQPDKSILMVLDHQAVFARVGAAWKISEWHMGNLR